MRWVVGEEDLHVLAFRLIASLPYRLHKISSGDDLKSLSLTGGVVHADDLEICAVSLNEIGLITKQLPTDSVALIGG